MANEQTMKSFAKVEDRTRDSDNLYVSAFTRALYLPALFHAILAYSASHLGLTDPTYLEKADVHTTAATDALVQVISGNVANIDVEGLLSAIFILTKREHMTCGDGSIQRVRSLLDVAGDVITSPRGVVAVGEVGGFARRVTLRLAYVDCRAALFRLGGGGLVGQLRSVPTLRDLFDSSPAGDGMSGAIALLRSNLFRLRVSDIDQRLHNALTEDVVSSRGVRPDEVARLRSEIEADLLSVDLHDEGGDPDAVHYNQWVVTASYHADLLYLNYICVSTKSLSPKLNLRHCLVSIHIPPFFASSPFTLPLAQTRCAAERPRPFGRLPFSWPVFPRRTRFIERGFAIISNGASGGVQMFV